MRAVVAANQAQVLGLPVDDPRVVLATKEAFELYARFWFDAFLIRHLARRGGQRAHAVPRVRAHRPGGGAGPRMHLRDPAHGELGSGRARAGDQRLQDRGRGRGAEAPTPVRPVPPAPRGARPEGDPPHEERPRRSAAQAAPGRQLGDRARCRSGPVGPRHRGRDVRCNAQGAGGAGAPVDHERRPDLDVLVEYARGRMGGSDRSPARGATAPATCGRTSPPSRARWLGPSRGRSRRDRPTGTCSNRAGRTPPRSTRAGPASTSRTPHEDPARLPLCLGRAGRGAGPRRRARDPAASSWARGARARSGDRACAGAVRPHGRPPRPDPLRREGRADLLLAGVVAPDP